jgi:hypothetical protein
MSISLLRPIAVGVISLNAAGCDGVYSSTSDGVGNVVVVNRFTGEAQSIRGTTVVAVKAPAASSGAAKKAASPQHAALYPIPINNQPFSVKALTKFRDGKILVRISIDPATSSMSEEEWSAWRGHLLATQMGNAAINVLFTDGDDFDVSSQRLPLTSMTQRLGLDNKLDSLDYQFSAEMSEETYEAIGGWNVTWQGYWPPYAAPDKTKSSQK